MSLGLHKHRHTDTDTHTNACTNTHTHTQIHALIQTYAHTNTRPKCMHAYAQTHIDMVLMNTSLNY